MEIRKLEIDFNKGILKINGKDYTDRKVVVSLPGESGYYSIQVNRLISEENTID